MIEKINKATEFLKSRINFSPKLGIILGTGLNSIAEMVQNPIIIPYEDIPGIAVSTAPSHIGQLIAGEINSLKVIIMQGRLHYYEGYSMAEITSPIRILKNLGITHLLITNAVGSLNKNFLLGDLVLITDHMNFMGSNPLIGKSYEEFGEHFPSMHEPYNLELIKLAQKIAKENKFEIKTGIYAAMSGPSLETNAECKMLRTLGADLVGMSTVPEVIVGIQCELKILGISVVTNLSNLFHSEPHDQQDIQNIAAKAGKKLEILILNLIKKI